jgi:hypothetical protein
VCRKALSCVSSHLFVLCLTLGLELVIRSHEMVPWGYSVAHDHKVVTVFSASSYCGTNDNFGTRLLQHSSLRSQTASQ